MTHQTNAIDSSRFSALGSFIALDFETSGLDPQTDSVIDIGAILYANGEEMRRFSTLIRPAKKVPLEILQLTGIEEHELETAPQMEDIIDDFRLFLGDYPIMAHNADFERAFLQKLFGVEYNPPMLDTCHLLALIFPLSPSFSLEHFIEHFGLREYEHHRGLQDALDMVAIVRALDEELQKPIYAELCSIVEYWFSKTDAWLWSPFFAGRYANIFGEEEPKYRNFKSLYDEKERVAIRPELARAPSMLADVDFFLRAYSHYRNRPAQQELASTAARVLNDGGLYVAEAGTGTGKTLAYLTAVLAALAVDSETPIVVSTHTKALQNQFIEQELPRLRSLFSLPDLRAVALKGMNNYACVRKIREALPLFESYLYSDNTEECFAGAFLTRWILATEEGEIEEIPRPLHTFPIIKKAASEARADYRDCTRHECAHYHECFYFKKQWEAASAHIIAVNHSLFLTYPKSYPEFNRFVIDEADEIIPEAISAFSFIASESLLREIQRHLSGTDNLFEQASREIALLARSSSGKRTPPRLPDSQELQSLAERFSTTILRLSAIFSGVRSDDVFTVQASLSDQRFSPAQREQILTEAENLKLIAIELANAVEQISRAASQVGASPNEIPSVRELQYRGEDLALIVQTLTLFLEQREDEAALYIRIEKQEWSFVATPFNVGERFAREILSPRYAAVFTSATISATKDMSDFLSGIGAAHWEGAPIVKNRFPSPFDYRNNAKIIFLKKFAANTHPDFPTLSAEFIAQAAEAVGGGILVLFTSKDRQRKVHEELFPLVRPKGIELLSHGITHSSQHKAIQRFKQSKAAILMGARGLWKGVDIPGDDLQCLILEKMPYAVPNPFTKGLQQQVIRRCQEEAESQGARVDEKQLIGKAWNEVEKPSMFQAFRQMFGRLIRTETDRGVMIVLDSQLQNNTLTPRHKQLLELLHGARYGVATANQALQELALHLRKL